MQGTGLPTCKEAVMEESLNFESCEEEPKWLEEERTIAQATVLPSCSVKDVTNRLETMIAQKTVVPALNLNFGREKRPMTQTQVTDFPACSVKNLTNPTETNQMQAMDSPEGSSNEEEDENGADEKKKTQTQQRILQPAVSKM